MTATFPIDIVILRQLVRYDPDTGYLYWSQKPAELARPGRNPPFKKRWGQQIRSVEPGYVKLLIYKKWYMGHRVAWALHYGEWPVRKLDHINGDVRDNRIVNLRQVTDSENSRNQRLPKDNTSGHIGVARSPNKQRWVARILVDYRTIHLGTFDTVEEAGAARKAAEARYRFHPNHGRRA